MESQTTAAIDYQPAAARWRRRRTEMPRRGNKRKLEKTAMDPVPYETVRSSRSRSVYLVIGHQLSHPAYSVYKVKVKRPFPAEDGGGDTPRRIRRRLRPVARVYAKLSMSFVPMRSRLGSWIVGVGGDLAKEDYGPETVVFDTKTRAVITGPKLSSTKFYSRLLPVGDRIYALSRFPNVKEDLDFVPWFEVLDLSEARVADGRLVNCEWKAMPRPPFFPWELTPRQYLFPPEITVKSYVAVGSWILVSITGGQTGTHMFDTETEQWAAKLDDEDLPFIGGAIPHGPLLFLGVSRANENITAYKITVTKGKNNPSLSIVEFPMVTDWEVEEVVSSARFVSLGNQGLCSFTCRSIDRKRMPGPKYVGERVSMRAYTIENPLSQDHHLKSVRNLYVSNQREHVYNVRDTFRPGLETSLEAVISL